MNYFAVPFYLFDPIDTLDIIDKASLVPMLWAMIRVVESTADVSATKMRSGAF